jgi:hypothetical protein
MTAHLDHLSNKFSLPINEDAFDSSAADIETGKKDGRSGHDQGGIPRRNASIRAPPSNVNFARLNGSTAFSKIPKPRPSYPARGSPPPRGDQQKDTTHPSRYGGTKMVRRLKRIVKNCNYFFKIQIILMRDVDRVF